MSNKKRNIVIIIGAVVVALVAVAVIFLWEPAPTGAMVGVTDLPDSLNPILEQNLSGLNADELVFDGLTNAEVDVASAKRSFELALAEEITQDPKTKKTYTIKLKPINWHDGTRLTAQDVEFSFAAYTDPANQSPKRDFLMSFISAVKAIDDSTVEIEFTKPIPEFRVYPILTFKIIPSTFKGVKLSTNLRAGENERKFATEPVGTGPFQLSKWEIGKWVSFTANINYFKRKPATETLVMRKIIDPVIRLNEFSKGRINLILETSPLDRPKAEKIGGVNIKWYLPYAFYQVAINTKTSLFGDVNARAALSAAVNRASLVPGVTDRAEGVVLNAGPFPSNVFTENWPEYTTIQPLNDPYPYNVDAAKKMAETGHLAGKSAVMLFPDSMGEFGQKMADSLVAQYAAIGLTVEAKRTGDQVFKRLVYTEKNYDLALMYSDGFDNLYSDLSTYFQSNGSNNVYGIADSALDKLFDEWNSTPTTADWVDITRKIHSEVSRLAPAVFLCTVEKDIYSRGLKDVVIISDNPFLSAEDWALGNK